MKRREFLKVSAAGAAVAAVASPAIAQSAPEVKWRLASSFPKSLDTIYGGAEMMAKQVAEMTDNKFQIQVFAAGELVPGLQALDATSNGTVEMCHTVSYYYVGKDPTFAIYASVPFGLNARQQNSWWYQGGGEQLGNEFFKKFGVIGHPCGNTGTQMGGWFRKEIKTVADLSGLKMRIGGIAGQVLQKVGVVPQQLAGGDIYPSLEKGTIDAAEWVGPYDDEKLGFQKVAKYYYYPGFWEGGPTVHAFTNLEKCNALPKNYQAILTNACATCQQLDGRSLRHAEPGGAEAVWSRAARSCVRSPMKFWKPASRRPTSCGPKSPRKNADFKKSIDAMQAYRSDEYLWWQVAEYTFDSFMIRSRTRG